MDMGSQSKLERLREVGIITSDELPEEYAAVVDSLTPDELETLVSVRKRLDLAQTVSGIEIGKNFVAP